IGFPAMDEQQWYYVQDNQQRGPLPLAMLRQLLSGELPRETLVWRAGLPNWQPAGAFPELFEIPVQPPPVSYPSSAPPPMAPSGLAPLSYGGYPTALPPEDYSSKAMTAFVLSLVGLIPCIG